MRRMLRGSVLRVLRKLRPEMLEEELMRSVRDEILEMEREMEILKLSLIHI